MRTVEEFARGTEEFVAGLASAQHAGDFGWSIGGLQASDPATSHSAPLGFFHDQMAVRERSDLRQVGHTEDLMIARELIQLATDDLPDSASDAGVDLVENHRRDTAALRDRKSVV